MATTFTRDLLGNEQADITLPSGTRFQIVQIDSGVYFGLNTGSGWSPVAPFRYAEGWRSRNDHYKPWTRATFRAMITDFIAEGDNTEETA